MRAAVTGVFVSGLVLSVAVLAFFGGRAALGVAIGGALATANLAVFARIVDAFLARRGHAAAWTVAAMLKLLFLFGVVWLILKSDIAPGISIAVGYGALPLGITLASLFGPRPPNVIEDPPGKNQSAGNHPNGEDNFPE
jgi:hypothetical protein